MKLGMIGLGRMGLGMSARLVAKGHTVVGFDIDSGKRAAAEQKGITWAGSPGDLIGALPPPRIVLLSVPAGPGVTDAFAALDPLISAGDLIVDTGNSFYRESMGRAVELGRREIGFLDVGVSGGVWGAENAYCLMVGGRAEDYARAEPILKDIACEGGCARVGGIGSGHLVKMVHNAIEYGLMQAYAEGFEILKEAEDFDLAQVAELWSHGSVIRSWLLELAARALRETHDLQDIKGWVDDTGEGRWALREALDMGVPTPVIGLSLMMRFRSRQEDSFSAKLVAALRKQFGGHEVKPFDGAQDEPFDGAQDGPFDGAQDEP